MRKSNTPMQIKQQSRFLMVGISVLASAILLTRPAAARIRCEGEFQIVGGQKLATPYCEDDNLAQVARAYGSKVSGEAVRRSPLLKTEVCRFIGDDLRVKDTCDGFRNDGRRR